MIDTHCHIDEAIYDEDRTEVILRQQAAGVKAIVVPGVNIDSLHTVMQVCEQYPNYLFPALGLHPEDVGENYSADLTLVQKAIFRNRQKLVAIGEIGLDYYWDDRFKAEQKQVFETQLEWARDLELPVIIHNREATEDILHILRRFNTPQGDKYQSNRVIRGVFHCFTGSKEVAKQLIDLGMLLGIGGVLTFKNCKLAEHLSGVPLTRLVLETDSPYLTPVPHRGERNESRYMRYVVERLADVYSTTPEVIIDVTTANAQQFFGIKIEKN